MPNWNRNTPSPTPGEWVPCDVDMSTWKLVCIVCGGEGLEYPSAMSPRERSLWSKVFLAGHLTCAQTGSAS